MKTDYCSTHLREIEERLTVGKLAEIKKLYDSLCADREANIFGDMKALAILYELGKYEGRKSLKIKEDSHE